MELGGAAYALLCEILPFDDENISALYRKIQGDYLSIEQPVHMFNWWFLFTGWSL